MGNTSPSIDAVLKQFGLIATCNLTKSSHYDSHSEGCALGLTDNGRLAFAVCYVADRRKWKQRVSTRQLYQNGDGDPVHP
jgi:hypothetical protein